jgi:FkbM family methyltransferase
MKLRHAVNVLRNAFRSPGFRLFGLPFARDYLRFALRCARTWGSTRPGTLTLLGRRVEYPNQSHALFLVHEIFVEASYAFETQSPAPRIVDCGANVGLSIHFFKALHPEARIIAFEPEPATFSLLQGNLERAGLRDVEIRRAAVAGHEGTVVLFSPEDDRGSILSSIEQTWSGGAGSDVPAIRLSSVIDGPVDLLKLDVEGAEYGVVRELVASGAIRHVRQAVIEFHALPAEPDGAATLERLLTGAGMRVRIEGHPSSRVGLLRAERTDPSPAP